MSGSSVEDSSALRVLVDDYAYAVDNCDSAGVAELFSEDGVLELWPDPASPTPRTIRRGRSEIVAAIDLMARYYATMHVIANYSSRVDGDTAQGWTRCLAHHVEGEPDARIDLVLAVNYVDAFARTGVGWRFTKREVHVLWTSTTAVDTP
jgi:ketosteroid isomerase-like protein